MPKIAIGDQFEFYAGGPDGRTLGVLEHNGRNIWTVAKCKYTDGRHWHEMLHGAAATAFLTKCWKMEAARKEAFLRKENTDF